VGLKVLRHAQEDDSHASVEFVARYKIGGRGYRLHEASRFVREAGIWYYLDGAIKGD
jgi:SEC-C motif-containing protein